ncbi:MAG: hypothetical protein OEY49_04000 [Candidatus Heimdallarchaeota archaeon]|nr:hypothetical protein [Candidatus Heimdallarchaeota archaeon]
MTTIVDFIEEIEQHFEHGEYDKITNIINQFKANNQVNLFKARLLRHTGNHQQAITLISTEINNGINNPFILTEYYLENIYAHWHIGKVNAVLFLLDEVNKLLLANTSNTKQFLKIKANYLHIKALATMELISTEEGEALLLESIQIKEKIGVKRELALSYNNLGYLRLHINDINGALSNIKKCLSTSQEINNYHQIGLCLGNIIEIYIQNNNLPLAQQYLEQFDVLNQSHYHNKWINLWYRYSKAIVLQKSNSFRDKIHAEDLFIQIIDSELLSSSIHEKSIYYLCDLYLFQLQIEFDQEVYQNLNDLIKRLIRFAEEIQSEIVLIKAELLKSKILIIENNLIEAKAILFNLNKQMDKKYNKLLAHVISMELDQLLSREKLIDNLTEGSLPENLKETNINHLINDFMRQYPRISEINEEPVAFIILNESGMQLYSLIFNEQIEMNTHLISNFIFAFNVMANQIFQSDEGYIEKIQKQDHFITIKKKSDLYFCYFYVGDSNSSIHLIDTVIRKTEKLISEIAKSSFITEDLISQIDIIIQQIFKNLTK